ncbi:hypothetical protein A2154_02225 [Candidatus Gottesmanbacteria bacterium RBG_16_43_7]|uniref:Zinc chelation protein SecC n=1 Tax=Candidatus Gottesmanbacteria bacterium RBG_16_43_7 TaxID=1798373 RepID=A0A1F5Z8T8_9BACT|nr:MAG: hypothetical protein A2154_02225 [Candidatus Gottesmanbacteria bacterium RBG_16_43_7]
MKRSVAMNTKGFLAAPRERFNLLRDGLLTDEEFIFYECCIAQAGWDDERDTFGMYRAPNTVMGGLLGWSEDKTARCRRGLLKKGYLTPDQSDSFVVKNFENYLFRLAFNKVKKDRYKKAELQTKDANIPDEQADLHVLPANLHSTESALVSNNSPNKPFQTSISDISSYKTSYSFIQKESTPAHEVKQSSNSEDKEVSTQDTTGEDFDTEMYLQEKYGPDAICFCGSGKRFWDCCKPLIDESLAESTPILDKL